MNNGMLYSGQSFSDEQLLAITHINGPMMVVAGPGSGKTTVITHRIKYLIESAGIKPADILVITFTRAAAYEMEMRFKALNEGIGYQVRFGTFHSIFFWIIKTAYNMNSSSVISEDEKRKLLDKIMKSMSIEFDNKDDMISSILSQISLVKCDMLDIDNYYSRDLPENTFRELYKRLDRELKRNSKIDFDDMMVMCYDLLVKRPDILEKCRQIFKFILVDEFQDCNKLQYEIFKLLAMPLNNAFIVGDDDQSVYGFRGARPEIMHQFVKDFPGTKQVMLGTNYRCDKNITALSSYVIGKNKSRFSKKLTSNSAKDGIVQVINVKDENDENLHLIKLINEHYASGIPYEKQAVLYRTNIQPRRLVYKLDGYNIPYSISDSLPNIFDHFVVKNILDYMCIAQGDLSRDRMLRIINKPGRYINRELLLENPVDYDKLRFRLRDKPYAEENLDKLMADLRLIKRLRPYPALNYIRKSVGYDDYIKEYAEYRQIDGGALVDVLDEFASMIVDMDSYDELFSFIDDYTEVLIKQQKKSSGRQGINLMTMHSAKGLEFDVVYIIDAVEEITPYKKAKSKSELEEERRMFYVAMTRARHELNVYVPKLVAGRAKDKSRYVRDMEKIILLSQKNQR